MDHQKRSLAALNKAMSTPAVKNDKNEREVEPLKPEKVKVQTNIKVADDVFGDEFDIGFDEHRDFVESEIRESE
jgi:hypothetical protein